MSASAPGDESAAEDSGGHVPPSAEPGAASTGEPAGRLAALSVCTPVAGRVLAMVEVPDPVFSAAMVGPGLAVDPMRAPGTAVSPIAGSIAKLHPHAFVVVAGDGRGVLVHLGIDTVQLKGAGFELLAQEGDAVEPGTAVVRWNPADVEAGGRSPVCPVVALDAGADAVSDPEPVGRWLTAGERLFTWA
jgi:PTS system glucose-specific IIA component